MPDFYIMFHTTKSAGDRDGQTAQEINQALSTVKAIFPLKQIRIKQGAKFSETHKFILAKVSAVGTFLSSKRKQNYPANSKLSVQ